MIGAARRVLGGAGMALTGLVIASVTGCQSTTPPESAVSHSWTETSRRLGYIPVLPPREDVRVGDLFVFPDCPPAGTPQMDLQAAARRAILPRWGAVPVADELDAEYLTRPPFPKTPDAFLRMNDEPAGGELPESAAVSGDSIYSLQE